MSPAQTKRFPTDHCSATGLRCADNRTLCDNPFKSASADSIGGSAFRWVVKLSPQKNEKKNDKKNENDQTSILSLFSTRRRQCSARRRFYRLAGKANFHAQAQWRCVDGERRAFTGTSSLSLHRGW